MLEGKTRECPFFKVQSGKKKVWNVRYWEENRSKQIEILYLLMVLLLIPLNKVPCDRFAVFTRFSSEWCKNNFCVFSESRSIHNQGQFVPLQNFNDSITCNSIEIIENKKSRKVRKSEGHKEPTKIRHIFRNVTYESLKKCE